MARILITPDLHKIISEAREKAIFCETDLPILDEDIKLGSLGAQSLMALRTAITKIPGAKSISDSLTGHKQVLLFNRKVKSETESEEVSDPPAI